MFQEVCDHIWFIQGNNNGRYPFSNSLYIDAQRKVLIDTGIGRSVIKKVLNRFGQPDMIIYSHGHEDHIFDPDLFTSARFIHEKDRLMATSKDELYRIYGLNTPELQKMFDGFLKSFHYQPLSAISTFTPEQIFDLGNIQVQVLYCPGHSAGHCCFEIPDEHLIFFSDIDLTSFGPWYGGLDSDIRAFEQSIKDLIAKSPKTVITSHKGIFTDEISEKLYMYLKTIKERENKILTFLENDNGKTIEELVPQALIYGRIAEPKAFYLAAEQIMLHKHLAILLEENKIECSHGKYKTL